MKCSINVNLCFLWMISIMIFTVQCEPGPSFKIAFITNVCSVCMTSTMARHVLGSLETTSRKRASVDGTENP